MKALFIIILSFICLDSFCQVERIDVQSIYKNPNGYCEYQVLFKAKIPSKLTSLPDFESNAQALYQIDSIEVIGSEKYAVYSSRISILIYKSANGLTNQADVQSRLESELAALESKLNAMIPYPFGVIKEQIYIDSTWINQ